MNRLAAYERKVWSQNGEDGIIEYLTAGMAGGHFVEIGWAPHENNTLYLVERGWRGKVYDAALAESRSYFWGEAERRYVCPLDMQHIIPPRLDFLSVDVDGQDYWLLESMFAAGKRPHLICVEYNAAFGPDIGVTVPYNADWQWDGTAYFGASLAALTWLAQSYGYGLAGTDSTGTNAFFVEGLLFPLQPREAYTSAAYQQYPPGNGPLVYLRPLNLDKRGEGG